MTIAANGITRNHLLRALASDDFSFVAQYLQRVHLHAGCVLAQVGDRIEFVCFPEDGVISIADVYSDGDRVEIGIVGREGLTNASILLGCDVATHDAIVQISGGTALCLPTDRLMDLCMRSPDAQAVLLRFVQSFAIQTGRTLASNLRDPVTRRLARWLLMYHDRIDGDEIRLIHETIGRLLGVRRATITDGLHILESERAITGRRGSILIRDRSCLEALAGESYGYAEAHYRRLIGNNESKASRISAPSMASSRPRQFLPERTVSGGIP